MHENALGQYLRHQRGSESLRSFAGRCQISHTHLDSIEKGADPRSGKPVAISTETLRLIGDGIGVDYLFLACLADGADPLAVRNIKIPDDYLCFRNAINDASKHAVLNQQFDTLPLSEKIRLLSVGDNIVRSTKISEDFNSIIEIAERLNDTGLQKFLEYGQDLLSSGKYEKAAPSEKEAAV